MALLFEEDYQILKDSGLEYIEDETQRFLVIQNFPLPTGLYIHNGTLLEQVEVLWVVPGNYNTSGGDMFWVHPALVRADGNVIPRAAGFGGGDPRHFQGREYCRWSRHWAEESWCPKIDNIQKVLGRIDWALRKPDAIR
jgi:Prokaryotic E2 family E